ncbi:hypothetical protein LR69_00247 [Geobacillus sp. BCO2]|nr:hypothetical protein LR69_00247 [Geobacillus sp. BCO2]
MARNNNQVKRDAAGRLFFLLDRQYRFVIQQVVALKPHVFAIAARQGMFVAKAYRVPVAAARHAWLLAALRKNGFPPRRPRCRSARRSGGSWRMLLAADGICGRSASNLVCRLG